MKISDVVNQLAKIIPQETDFFSDTLGITSITSDGSIATVETASPHGLTTGEYINVRGVASENDIVTVEFATVNGRSELTIVTESNHDLTLNPRATSAQFVELIGFVSPSWNGSFELINVANRRTFTIVNGTVIAPILATTEKLLEVVLGRFNGPQTPTVVDTTHFTYPSNFIGDGQNGNIQARLRIAGIVNFERALDQYTNKIVSDYFMFVHAPVSVTANKSRGSQTDINDEQTQQSNFNENIKDGFIILVLANVSTEAGALTAMDNIRDEVFLAILKAVRGFKFASGLACEPNQVASFLNHGTLLYDNARYGHQFIFEMPLVMTIADSVQMETRAFRDIDFTTAHPGNTAAPVLTANIDLDNSGIAFLGSLVGDIGQLNP